MDSLINSFMNFMTDVPHLYFMVAWMPEILVTLSAFVLLLGGVFANNARTDRIILWLSIFVLFSLMGFMLMLQTPALALPFFKTDAFSTLVKFMLLAGTTFSLMLSDSWFVRYGNQRFEYTILILFSLLGMLLMVSASNMLSAYLALELSSIPLYVLAAFNRDSLRSTESGLKYFVLSALASGLLLFGISFIYGFTGATGFNEIITFIAHSHGSLGITVGLVFIIVGFCFKISAAPFHMWAPDVYEGAPTPVTAFFSISPKIAALALFARLIYQPFGGLIHDWQQILIFVSVASMLIGAFGALTQGNIKRLLAYSSIGHVGYALMGLAAGNVDGVSGMLVYFTLYIPMSAGAFACVIMMERAGAVVESISDLSGLGRARPGMAFAFAVFMFSMAGIPPLAGFFGKMYVFLAAIHSGLMALAVIGVLSSVVACFYYLKIIKVMYFDEPVEPLDGVSPLATRITLVICTFAVLFFFLFPAPLVVQARIAAEALFQ
jgi:NADH-quinone oxidoreductase subunit N